MSPRYTATFKGGPKVTGLAAEGTTPKFCGVIKTFKSRKGDDPKYVRTFFAETREHVEHFMKRQLSKFGAKAEILITDKVKKA